MDTIPGMITISANKYIIPIDNLAIIRMVSTTPTFAKIRVTTSDFFHKPKLMIAPNAKAL